jgi:DNA-binding IclR family transcriptional regulator
MVSRSATDKGEHQNIARTGLVLGALAAAGDAGLKLTDVVRATGLGKTSCHRALGGLVAHGFVDQDARSGAYFLGLRMLEWAARATQRYGLYPFVAPSLDRLAGATADTVYFSMTSGMEAVCVDRREGAFPIKTLTLRLGDRRPLGIGSGSLALLAAMRDEEIEEVVAMQRSARARYEIDNVLLRRMILETRERGFAVIEGQIIPGMNAVGVALCNSAGAPVAAISVAAITARLDASRRAGVARQIRTEIDAIRRAASAVLMSPLARSI